MFVKIVSLFVCDGPVSLLACGGPVDMSGLDRPLYQNEVYCVAFKSKS